MLSLNERKEVSVVKVRVSKGTALVAVGVAAATLTACFTANLSGRAKSASVIQSGKSIELEIKSTDSLGTGIGSVSGRFKDSGTNIAFPYGVSLSFNKGTTYGFGFSCSEVGGGPRRVAHSRPAGVSGPAGLCPLPNTGSARVWMGFVTYSSADKRVPNVSNPECAALYYYYLHFGTLQAPTSSQLASVRSKALSDPTSKAITGFGELVIVDTNHDGQPGPTDGYGFAAVCGPYTNLDPSVLQRPVGSNSVLGYSYATCPAGAFGGAPGGVYPTDLAWSGGPSAVAEMLVSECGGPIRSGNLKVGIATDWSSGVTGPIIPPPN